MTQIIQRIFIFGIVMSVLLTAGCVSQTGDQNITNHVPATVRAVQTACPSQSETAIPYININPIGNHYVGEVIEITGTTNLGTDSNISFDIREPMHLDTAPRPNAPATPDYQYSGTAGFAIIRNGTCGTNVWSYTVNLSGYHEQRYTVNVWDEANSKIQNATQFMVTK